MPWLEPQRVDDEAKTTTRPHSITTAGSAKLPPHQGSAEANEGISNLTACWFVDG